MKTPYITSFVSLIAIFFLVALSGMSDRSRMILLSDFTHGIKAKIPGLEEGYAHYRGDTIFYKLAQPGGSDSVVVKPLTGDSYVFTRNMALRASWEGWQGQDQNPLRSADAYQLVKKVVIKGECQFKKISDVYHLYEYLQRNQEELFGSTVPEWRLKKYVANLVSDPTF